MNLGTYHVCSTWVFPTELFSETTLLLSSLVVSADFFSMAWTMPTTMLKGLYVTGPFALINNLQEPANSVV